MWVVPISLAFVPHNFSSLIILFHSFLVLTGWQLIKYEMIIDQSLKSKCIESGETSGRARL